MGTSKAWLPLGGEYLVQRIVRVVGETVTPIVAAGRLGQSLPALPAEVRMAYDAAGQEGPLAGVAAGFESLHDSCDAVFVTGCDTALIQPALIRRLIELLEDHDAVVPRQEGRLHPLTAVYHLRTSELLNRLLVEKERRVHTFVERCAARMVDAEVLREVDPQLLSLRNVNEPGDYEQLLREFGDEQRQR